MANVDDPVDTGTPATVNAGPDPSAVSAPDPREERYQALEQYYARTNPILEQYKDDFNAIVEDEGYRNFQRQSRESYYDMQKRLAAEKDAEIPESEKRLLGALDERLGKFKPVLDDYERRAETEKRTATEASQEFAKKETEFANRLVAESKLTPEEVNELAEYAMTLHQKSVKDGNPRFVGIEEVYKRVYGRAEAKVTQAKPVAKSLRSTAGATGVPGASRTIEDRGDLAKPGGVTRHILGVLNSQRKTG
jgi:hypothetical protein